MSFCIICNNRFTVFGENTCGVCKANQPDQTDFSYSNSRQDPHENMKFQANRRLNLGQKSLKRGRSSFESEANLDHETLEPKFKRRNSFSDVSEANIKHEKSIQCMVLFIAFDASNNFYHKNSVNGTKKINVIPTGNNTYSFISDPTSTHTIEDLNKAFPKNEAEVFEAATKKSMDQDEVANNYDTIVYEQIKTCTNQPVWNIIGNSTNTANRSQLTEYCPEIIFLSEELTGAKFPDELHPCPQLTYKKINNIKNIRSDLTVDCKNEMAVYLLDDKSLSEFMYTARVIVRSSTGDKTEKWLGVKKLSCKYNVSIEIAGVHLDSKYTSNKKGKKKENTLTEVGKHAQTELIDALLGDLNMDSFELSGGFFANDFSFTDEFKPVFTLSNSSSNNACRYMGGMIINQQVETKPMNLNGLGMMSLSRSLAGNFYSDHPAIAANYVKKFYV